MANKRSSRMKFGQCHELNHFVNLNVEFEDWFFMQKFNSSKEYIFLQLSEFVIWISLIFWPISNDFQWKFSTKNFPTYFASINLNQPNCYEFNINCALLKISSSFGIVVFLLIFMHYLHFLVLWLACTTNQVLNIILSCQKISHQNFSRVFIL